MNVTATSNAYAAATDPSSTAGTTSDVLSQTTGDTIDVDNT